MRTLQRHKLYLWAGMVTSTSQGRDPNELLEDDSVPSTSGRLHVQIGRCTNAICHQHSVTHELCCSNQDTSVQTRQEHFLRWWMFPGMLCKSCRYAGSGQHVDDEGVPRWRLRCQREAELASLSTKLADLSKFMLDKVHQCARKLAASIAVAHLVAEVCKLGHTCKLRKLHVV